MGSLWRACVSSVFSRDHSGGRSVYTGSLGSLWRAIGVVGLIQGPSCAHWGSYGSSAVVVIDPELTVCRWVHPGSLDSLRGSSGVDGFTLTGPGCRWIRRRRLVCSRAPWESLGSSGDVVFTRTRSMGHWVNPGSLSSGTHALGVDGFISGRSFRSWWSLGSSGVVVFAPAHPGGSCVHLGSLGSLAHALGFVGFMQARCVCSRTLWDSLGSFFSLAPALGTVGFIWCRLVRSHAPRGHWVHQVWLCSLSGAGGFGFIRKLWVLSCTPSMSLGSWVMAVGFPRARHGGRLLHPG